MKKIICILTALVMLVACFAVCASAADPKRAATVIAADESGYGIWAKDHKSIKVYLANDTVADNIINRKTFANLKRITT